MKQKTHTKKKKDIINSVELPCCKVVSTEWYIGADGKQRFICPKCRSVYIIKNRR